MKKELLIKTDKNTLELIKQEAEKNLVNIHSIEDKITDKSSNLLKTVISFFIITSGYSIRYLSLKEHTSLFYFAVTLSVLFFILIFILSLVIFPKYTVAIGSEPKKNVDKNFIRGDEYDEYRILCNKIECLQCDIESSLSSYRKRLNLFKSSYKLLIFSLLFIFLTFSLFYLSQDAY